MLDEDRADADKCLRGACMRLTRQIFYNQKHTCISAFCAERGKRAKKEDNVKDPPEMTVEDYMTVSKLTMRFYIAAKLPLHDLFFTCVLHFQVMPTWADEKEEAWRLVVQRWVGEDAEFDATSKRNKANRGSGGTHGAGSRSTARFKEKLVCAYMEAFISRHVPT